MEGDDDEDTDSSSTKQRTLSVVNLHDLASRLRFADSV